jgi:aminopeptidase N
MKNKLQKTTLYFLLLTALLSCKTIDKQANTSNTIKEQMNYMPSYTRLSDITHMQLNIALNWDSCFVIGNVTLTVKPYFYTSEELILDAKGFKINFIKVNGTTAPYTYDGKKINIRLPREFKKEESYTVNIDYIAQPNKLKVNGSSSISSDKGFYFINPQGKIKNKPREFWTQGETEANSAWFPTIESTSEKYTQEIAITLENNFVSLSNGYLAYSTQHSNGTRTDVWKQDLPHSAYLTMVAGGNFAVIKDHWKNMEVNYYVEPKYKSTAKLIFGNTPEMINLFSEKLGVDYPWDKYSQIVVRDFVAGAMENTGAVTFAEDMNMDARAVIDNPDEETISHELFHHWFGDLVTAESWPNLPLNESFATYGEYIWADYKYGREEADRAANEDLIKYLRTSKTKKVNMIRFDLTDREDMFDNYSYQKGGRIIHMLRKTVGDDAFFASLKLYLEKNKFKAAEIHHLRLAFEEVTGQDLNWFFNQWFLAPGHPELNINYSYDSINKNAIVSISQEQDLSKFPLYQLPISIDIYANGKVDRKNITISKSKEFFTFNSITAPDLINVDAEKMLVCTKKDNHSMAEWIYLYKHGALFLDRLEAIDALKKYTSDTAALAIIQKGLNDINFEIRKTCINILAENKQLLNSSTIVEKIQLLAKMDPKSSVRATAISALAANNPNETSKAIILNAINDSSYVVVQKALNALYLFDKLSAVAKAESLENIESDFVQMAIANIYAEQGDKKFMPYFINQFSLNAYNKQYYIGKYFKTYLAKIDDETIEKGLLMIKTIIENAYQEKIEFNAKSTLADMLANADTEILKDKIKLIMKEIDAEK